MGTPSKQLYLFLTACGGDWKNSVHISCREVQDAPGYLFAADRDGQPVIMSIQRFRQLTGTWIDPDECCGHLTETGFEILYTQYLLWRCPTAEKHPLRRLCGGTTDI